MTDTIQRFSLQLSRSIRLGTFAVLSGMPFAAALAQPAPIPTLILQPKQSPAAYEMDGVVQAVKQSVVSAQASGRIAALLVKAGDRVRAGQILATIDDREAAVGVQRSQAQMNQAEAELQNTKANLERTKELQSKGFVSQAALDVAATQYQSGLAARDQALASAKQSSISQGFTRVSAPFDGWVQQTHADAGDLAVPGKPLVTIYAPQPLRAVVQVPGSRSQTVRTAKQTLVQIEDTTGTQQWIAPLSRSAVPSADPVSQTTEWRMDLPAKESTTLVPGQQIRVRFEEAQTSVRAKLLVPTSAIVKRGELTAVYVATAPGAFALRAVRLGQAHGSDSVEVVAGVSAGEAIALDPIRAGSASTSRTKN